MTTISPPRSEMQVSNLNDSGFTPGEQKVMDALILAFNEFCDIERQHPDEGRDFCNGIHVLQNILACRIARREYPAGWPTYSDNMATIYKSK